MYENPQLYMPYAGLALQDSVFVGVMPQNLEMQKKHEEHNPIRKKKHVDHVPIFWGLLYILFFFWYIYKNVMGCVAIPLILNTPIAWSQLCGKSLLTKVSKGVLNIRGMGLQS